MSEIMTECLYLSVSVMRDFFDHRGSRVRSNPVWKACQPHTEVFFHAISLHTKIQAVHTKVSNQI